MNLSAVIDGSLVLLGSWMRQTTVQPITGCRNRFSYGEHNSQQQSLKYSFHRIQKLQNRKASLYVVQ